jgi:hypothetical protein
MEDLGIGNELAHLARVVAGSIIIVPTDVVDSAQDEKISTPEKSKMGRAGSCAPLRSIRR